MKLFYTFREKPTFKLIDSRPAKAMAGKFRGNDNIFLGFHNTGIVNSSVAILSGRGPNDYCYGL